MAFTSIIFENPNTGAIKEAPVGFSWTTAFFVFFPPAFRGDWKWFFIMLVLAILTAGMSALAFMFIYNKLYIKELIGNGFKARSIATGSMELAEIKLGMKLPRLHSE